MLTKYNKHKNQLSKGKQVSNPISPEELKELEGLQKIWNQKKKERDNATAKQTAISANIESYRLARKRDPSSVHNKVENFWKENSLNRGKAFGGKFQDIDARPVMKHPSRFFGPDMKTILI